ncbi:MAG: hypothetical protein U1F52_07365 [Burkholderiales bacterium]
MTVELSNASALTVDNVVVQLFRGGYGGSAFSFTPSIGSFDADTGRWTVGTLAGGGRATLQLSGSSGSPGGNVSATVQPATVSGFANQDPNSGNNRDSVTWRTDPARADLGVDVRGPVSSVIAGRTVGVTVELSNASALTVDDVVVQLFRGGYGGSAFSFTPSIGSFDADTGRWTVGTLAGEGAPRCNSRAAVGLPAGTSARLCNPRRCRASRTRTRTAATIGTASRGGRIRRGRISASTFTACRRMRPSWAGTSTWRSSFRMPVAAA